MSLYAICWRIKHDLKVFLHVGVVPKSVILVLGRWRPGDHGFKDRLHYRKFESSLETRKSASEKPKATFPQVSYKGRGRFSCTVQTSGNQRWSHGHTNYHQNKTRCLCLLVGRNGSKPLIPPLKLSSSTCPPLDVRFITEHNLGFRAA